MGSDGGWEAIEMLDRLMAVEVAGDIRMRANFERFPYGL